MLHVIVDKVCFSLTMPMYYRRELGHWELANRELAVGLCPQRIFNGTLHTYNRLE
jgi:hypothetical protein